MWFPVVWRPLKERLIHGGGIRESPGSDVNQDVKPAQLRDSVLDRLFTGLVVADVSVDEIRADFVLVANLRGDVGSVLLVDIRDEDVRALVRELCGDAASDSRGRASHYRYVVSEVNAFAHPV